MNSQFAWVHWKRVLTKTKSNKGMEKKRQEPGVGNRDWVNLAKHTLP